MTPLRHFAFLNPQGNFDPADRYWTEHPDFGGQLVYVKNVALALGRLGHRVDVLTRRIDDPEWPEFATREDAWEGAPNVRIVRLDMGGDGRFLRKEDLWPFIGRDWVPAIERHYDAAGAWPDAVTGHYGDGGLATAILTDRRPRPSSFTAHSLGAQKLDKLFGQTQGSRAELEELDRRYHFARRIEAERIAMSRASVIITSTRQERHEQYAHPLYAGAVDVDDDTRFRVVPPGVDVTIFHPGPPSAATEAHVAAMLARDLAPDRRHLPAVVASSRLDPKKNHAVLIDAFAADADLRDRANLVILTGNLPDPLTDDGPASPAEREVLADLRRRIASSELRGAVAGFAVTGQRALADAYRAFAARRSVFALTAVYEPFGLAPLEAAACGLPVVVTRNGGPAESLREGDTEYGVLVDPLDPSDVAAGLRRALGPEWDRLAAAGRRRVLDRYTWERTAEGYMAALTEAPPGLPIHPFFLRGEPDVGLDRLVAVYLDH